MSLIQDALRRQQEESGDSRAEGAEPKPGLQNSLAPGETSGDVPGAEQTPSEPATTGETEESAVKKQETIPGKPAKPRVWMMVLGIVLFVVLVIGAVGFLISLSVSLVAKKNREKAAASISESAQSAGVPPAPVEPDVVSSRPAVVPVPESPLVSPPVAEAAPSAPVTPVQPPENRLNAAEREPQPTKPPADKPVMSVKPVAGESPKVSKPEPKRVSSAAPKPVPEPAVTKDLPPMEWPRLRLTAVLSGVGQGQDAARINDTMVSVGGEIEGVTLQEVQPEGVLLKYGHETRFLRMGASLY